MSQSLIGVAGHRGLHGPSTVVDDSLLVVDVLAKSGARRGHLAEYLPAGADFQVLRSERLNESQRRELTALVQVRSLPTHSTCFVLVSSGAISTALVVADIKGSDDVPCGYLGWRRETFMSIYRTGGIDAIKALVEGFLSAAETAGIQLIYGVVASEPVRNLIFEICDGCALSAKEFVSDRGLS